MAEGLHRNLENEAFVRTPPPMTERIVRNLLQFPRIQGNGINLPAPFMVTDPTAGEGDLLAPFAAVPGASLFGIELSVERADKARALLPSATIVSSPLEAVRFEGPFAQILASNPPYFLQNGKRAEYTLFKMATEHQLQPGGIGFAVLPARSAWDHTMAGFWVKHYERVQVFKFADGDPDTDEFAFGKYTQIVVIGVKRQTPLEEVEKGEYVRLRGYRYRKPEKEGDSWWAGGEAPPELPEAPVANPYIVPSGQMTPRYTLIKADDSQLLSALEESGAHLSTDWRAATYFEEKGSVAPSAMPLLGMAHMAADVLSGLFDGEVVLGYIMTTFTTQRFMEMPVDDEQKEKGVRGISQSVDHPILGVLDLGTGQVSYYEGSDDTFAFLHPLLPKFAPLVLAKRKPRYMLDPEDWEIDQISRIGLDKQLPGAAFAGLAVPQMHRVLALWRSLNGE